MSTATPTSFARTKIQAPRPRAELIERGKLEARLGAALAHQRLTLLLAPAGWGKTSALARQLARLPAGTAVTWVSADEDDDVPRFLAGLAAALEPLDLPWHVAPSALGTLSQAERGLRLVADELLNALAEAEVARGLIVIDDLHRVADPRLFELLTLLLQGLPAAWGLVLASRTEPPLPLARLRASGDLAEIQQGDLRFDAAEVAAMLRQSGAAGMEVMEGARADELLRRTEGWAAGLRLMLSVGSRGAGTAAFQPRHVFDYLADEVLAGMAPSLRLFLLRCAPLPELTPARCAHVSALPDALALFDQVEREGLFVTPLDGAGRTLRLHDLFRDFLEDRLQRDHADELPALLQRAADGEPDLARAVGWLARAGAWDRAAQELATRGPALVPVGGGAGIERLLGLFPADALQRHPELDVLRGWSGYHAFDFDGVATAMARAAAGFTRAGAADAAAWARLYQHISELSCGRQESARAGLLQLQAEDHGGATGAMTDYYCAWLAYSRFDAEGVAPNLDRAITKLERLDDAQTWQHAYFIAMLAGLTGMVPVLHRYLGAAEAIAGERASLLRVGVLHVRASLALGAGRIAEAREWLANADDDMHWLGSPRSLLTENLFLHLSIDALHGDHAACSQAAERLRADLRESGRANQRTHGGSTLSAELRSAWALGDEAWVHRVAREVGAAANPFQWALCDRERTIADGMVALLEGRHAEAEAQLMPQTIVECMPLAGGAQALMLCVEAQRRQGRIDAAAALLGRWFDSLADSASTGAALLAGPGILEGIASVPWGTRLSPARQEHLRGLAATAHAAREGGRSPDTSRDGADDPGPASTATRRLPAGLTPREAEVLSLVAQGQSNKHIARALDLSPLTVKRHVANILNKTVTASRTEVAAWWVSQRG